MKPVKVGVIGCGHISSVYFGNMKRFDCLDVVACADAIPKRAAEKAEEFGISKACSAADLLADADIEIVLNLTVPAAHYEVGMAAIGAGKSVYNEKPLSVTREDAQKLLDVAKEKGLLVGCAPDTVLGGGIQTARKIIDDGWTGNPVAASVTMMYPGPETFHPDPEFFYQPGAGPLYDMGPYYLTALALLMGPVKRVSCAARATYPERIIGSEPKRGQAIPVNTPTHISGLLEFANGAIATIVTTWEVWEPYGPQTLVYCTDGTLKVPDANGFTGPVLFRPKSAFAGPTLAEGAASFNEIPVAHSYGKADSIQRGIGVADMAYALRTGRPHRATGELALHVLDVIQSLLESAESGRRVAIHSKFKRPAPMPLGLREGALDE